MSVVPHLETKNCLNNFFLSKGMALGRRQESEIWREEIWRGKLVSDTPTL